MGFGRFTRGAQLPADQENASIRATVRFMNRTDLETAFLICHSVNDCGVIDRDDQNSTFPSGFKSMTATQS
jgi:hypothetical protein